MPRLTRSTPKYRLHRATGRAVVTVSGRDVDLGPWRSKASLVEYDRLVGQWLAAGRPSAMDGDASSMTIVELMARYGRFVRKHYVKNGVIL